MTRIAQEDLRDSLFEALQFISHHHPVDFLRALRRAWAGRDPPTGARGDRTTADQQPAQRAGAAAAVPGHRRRAGLPARGRWRAVHRAGTARNAAQPAGRRSTRRCAQPIPTRSTRCAPPWSRTRWGAGLNTRDNTPAVVFTEIVEGDRLEVLVAAKGGGGDVKARFATLNPSDNVADWVLAQVAGHGRGLVPTRRAGCRHRRQPRTGDAAGQAVIVRSHRHSTCCARAAPRMRRRPCGWTCTSVSTRWASGPRGWVG